MAKLHFYYSAMNAGKSTALLQSSYNYNERGMDTFLLAPALDSRYGQGVIGSRIGLKQKANIFQQNSDIFALVKAALKKNPNIRCVLVDEAQFLTKQQVQQLGDITDELTVPVLAYGIRTDFLGEPFVGSLYLLAWADLLIELKTICHCGKKATMNLRVDKVGKVTRDGAQVQIGGNESYIAVCRHHFKLEQPHS